MTTPYWAPIAGHMHLQWAPTHEPGTILIRDLRDPDSETLVHGPAESARFIAEHSRTDAYLPVGDWVAKATHALGIEKCTPCEKRQAFLNRLFPSFRFGPSK